MVARVAPGRDRLVSATRRALRTRLPTAHEIVYEYSDAVVISFSPNEHGYLGVLGIRASADGVGLFFNRASELPDPEKLLHGSGKLARALPLEGAATLTRPAVARLIDAAVAHTSVPFARSGQGPVVVRQTAATKKAKTKQTKRR